ncbi:MAG: hypothetical protein AM325_015760 [Candidatus Thorarchaeota archaeon SMTZ1-45]
MPKKSEKPTEAQLTRIAEKCNILPFPENVRFDTIATYGFQEGIQQELKRVLKLVDDIMRTCGLSIKKYYWLKLKKQIEGERNSKGLG